MEILDISRSLSPGTPVWPGDTPFSRDPVMSLEAGDSCNVSRITMSPHCGTHADAPLHFLEGTAGIDEVPLEAYLGPCLVLPIAPRGAPAEVPAPAIRALEGRGIERLLLRTRLPGQGEEEAFDEDFCCLGVEAARAAVDLGLRLIGLDTPSIDPFESKTLEAHKILLRGGVAILENLVLDGVEEGEWELLALPLKIREGDASPVRAVLRRA